MSEMLPTIAPRDVGGATIQTVDGRELYRALEVGRDFSSWINGRIEAYEFAEGADFVTYEAAPQIGGVGNRGARIEYALTIDMAKELSMVESNDAGGRCRRHFIECERRLKAEEPARAMPTRKTGTQSIRSAFRDFHAIAKLVGLEGNQAALAANRATVKLTGVDPLALLETTHLVAETQEKLLIATEIGARLGGLSAQAVNQRLLAHGFHEHDDSRGRSGWAPTDKGKPFGLWQDTSKRQGDGTPIRQWKWFATVVEHLREEPKLSVVQDAEDIGA